LSQSPSRPVIASIKGLTFRYPDAQRPAVKDLDLDILEGEIVLLAGPSGCGKSTLLRCVNGLVPHMYPGEYKGKVVIDGVSVADTPMSTLSQKVGLLFQNPENQIFMFSVERDVAFGLQNPSVPRDEMRARVDEAMRLLGITDLAQRAPHELSDGQKQRTALAGVIAMRPGLIILDEPTSLLDPQTALEVVALIEKLNRDLGITFVVVEHRLELLTPIAHRLVVMDDGAKVMDGPPSEVLSDPEVEAHGIGVPPTFKLYSSLVKDGLRLGGAPGSPEALAKELDSR
jgi:energy-coupling factor transporter ATP-binding protein EcfA2